jgi:hypothetical protein
MKIGDLVKLSPRRRDRRPAGSSLLGIIVSFDEDNDPVIQWFLDGSAICIEAEYRKDIKVF